MRVTRKMMNDNSVYNINANKEYMDKVNTQMATQKKYVDPSDDPITAIRALRFRNNLSEVTQFLDRNVSDAVSWTESTQTSIDSAKEIMRSLKSEYTSAANGTNESKDQRIYYQNMKNLVDEYFSLGNASTEDRHIFTGYRTQDSLTFTEADFEYRESSVQNGKYMYKGIKETFDLDDLENYSFTIGKKAGSTGITDDDITTLDTNALTAPNETDIKLVDVYRLRLSYEDIDSTKDSVSYDYKDNKGEIHSGSTEPLVLKITGSLISPDYSYQVVTQINGEDITSDAQIGEPADDEVYLNKVTGNLIFGKSV
ncbi:MAG: hypothetical protein K5668_02010, partial [Lachnospiraceae bacterium]|nr:hypothetical protein [Lachnospiraceae bacterium]